MGTGTYPFLGWENGVHCTGIVGIVFKETVAASVGN